MDFDPMDFDIRPMTVSEAEIISTWRYPPPYDLYDMTGVAEGIGGWLADDGNEGRHSVFSEGDLIGFLSFGEDARVPGGEYPDDALDTGFGMRPDLTGQGNGLSFVEAGLEYARREFAPRRFRLTVAEFNERAIKVYRRAGFETIRAFEQPGKGTSFIQMECGSCT